MLILPVFASAAPIECYCIGWLNQVRGIPIKGDAWTIRPTHSLSVADEGDVLLTDEGPGHGAEIIGFEGEIDMGTYIRPEYIVVIEANYTRCKVGTRKIAWTDPSIKGIWRYPQYTP